MTNQKTETPQQSEQSPLYQVSFERLTQLKRSAATLLAERRPASCPSLKKPGQKAPDPKKLVDEISKHWAGEEGYIRTEMPIQEIVFRVFLSRRNVPIPLRVLHHELTERWATPMRPITITEQGLQRVLDSDTYYGFAKVSSNPED